MTAGLRRSIGLLAQECKRIDRDVEDRLGPVGAHAMHVETIAILL